MLERIETASTAAFQVSVKSGPRNRRRLNVGPNRSNFVLGTQADVQDCSKFSDQFEAALPALRALRLNQRAQHCLCRSRQFRLLQLVLKALDEVAVDLPGVPASIRRNATRLLR
jgi:hypothetical protein